MADEPQEKNQTEEKGGSKKFIIYSSVIFVQLVAALLLVKFLLFPMFFDENSGNAEEEVKPEEEVAETVEMGEIYTIAGLTVNPKDSEGRRFGVFEVVLEIKSAEVKEKITKYEPIIRDKLISYFSSKTVAELSSGSVKEQSKVDIQQITNDVLKDEIVFNVYFTRYILQ